jgi:hypothetical protein
LQLLYILVYTCYSPSLYYNHPSGCKWYLIHCGFDLRFPNDWGSWASFHVLIGCLCIWFGEMSIFKLGCIFLLLSSFLFLWHWGLNSGPHAC